MKETDMTKNGFCYAGDNSPYIILKDWSRLIQESKKGIEIYSWQEKINYGEAIPFSRTKMKNWLKKNNFIE